MYLNKTFVVIVSFASYPERFIYLPDLMKFIKNQSFPINKIILSFYKEHKKFYNLNISDINIIYAEKNLKPHLKYYYTMQLFRDYAITIIFLYIKKYSNKFDFYIKSE